MKPAWGTGSQDLIQRLRRKLLEEPSWIGQVRRASWRAALSGWVALCSCNAPDSSTSARADDVSVPGPRPASSTVDASVVARQPVVARRSHTVLVVTPEFPPPLPGPEGFQFWLRTPYVTKGSRFEVSKLDGIAQAGCFVSESGSTIPAHGSEPDKTGRTTDGHRFVLRPDAPLAADQWYELLLSGDEFLRIADDFGAGPSGEGGVAHFTFFNGSAPRIVAVRRVDSGAAPVLDVVFSEPLRVTDALCQSLLRARRDVGDHDCEAQRRQLVDGVRLQLKSEDTAARPLELRVPAEARGESRSAAEGAKLRLRSPANALTLRLQPNDFSPCGAYQCWREPRPTELAPAPAACHL